MNHVRSALPRRKCPGVGNNPCFCYLAPLDTDPHLTCSRCRSNDCNVVTLVKSVMIGLRSNGRVLVRRYARGNRLFVMGRL